MLVGISAVDYADLLMPLYLSLTWPERLSVSEADQIVKVAVLQVPPAGAVLRPMVLYC